MMISRCNQQKVKRCVGRLVEIEEFSRDGRNEWGWERGIRDEKNEWVQKKKKKGGWSEYKG
jgi:hypothetical protein